MADKIKSKLGITYTITKVNRKGPGGTKNYLPYRVTSSDKGYTGSWQTKSKALNFIKAMAKIDAGGAKNLKRAKAESKARAGKAGAKGGGGGQ